jgi:hypothetical protein
MVTEATARFERRLDVLASRRRDDREGAKPMTIRILPKRSVASWIDRMRATRRVVAPKGSNGHVAFGEIESADEVALDYKTTILPPKKALLPTHEELFRFKDGETEGQVQATPAVLFGRTVLFRSHLRPACDRAADRAFRQRASGPAFSDAARDGDGRMNRPRAASTPSASRGPLPRRASTPPDRSRRSVCG